jgi:hypothetical protein
MAVVDHPFAFTVPPSVAELVVTPDAAPVVTVGGMKFVAYIRAVRVTS